MADDLTQWAIPEEVIVRAELVAHAEPPRPRNKVRHRPNKGRKKRPTAAIPPLPEPPWDLLRATGYPIPAGLQNLPYVPYIWRRGPIYVRWRKAVFETWGTVCHLCNHPGADSADHLIPLSVWPNQPYDVRISRPAHGVAGCPTCEVKCNSSRGNRQLAIQIANYEPPVAL